MGLSGKDYDRFSGPEYTPNKDRRMAEWRKKKDAERQADLEEKGKTEAAVTAEAEDKPEVKKIVHEPIQSTDTTIIDAINNGIPGATEQRPRRRKKPSILHPTLFDKVE